MDTVASAIKRFLLSYVPVTESGCFIWTGKSDRGGYGLLFSNGKRVMAHRFSYELSVGPIPEGLELDHICRVRCCVNPSHVRLLTHKENVLCGVSPASIHAKKTHCIHGHEYNEANTSIVLDGKQKRVCKVCNRRRSKDYKMRKLKMKELNWAMEEAEKELGA